MPAENAFPFLRSLDGPKPLGNPILIAGPHAFLREYVLDAVARRLMRDGLKYRAFQIANATDSASVMQELRAPDLFAPRRVMVCRVMRTYRERGGDTADDSGEESSGGRETRGGADAGLADAIAQCAPPNHLVIVYDKDSAPAKVRRAAESAGVSVTCLRPFDNQLPQYAQMFARGFDLKLSQNAAELIVSRHGGDLAAIANALWKIAIRLEKGAAVEAADLAEHGPAKLPEAFEIAESLSAGKSGSALTQLSRALAGGRDPVEILAVEVIPLMRRMMVAATMLAARKRDHEIGAALGFGPTSALATRAIDGARRFGLARLERVYQRASELDAGLKNGQVKDREEALSALFLDLLAS